MRARLPTLRRFPGGLLILLVAAVALSPAGCGRAATSAGTDASRLGPTASQSATAAPGAPGAPRAPGAAIPTGSRSGTGAPADDRPVIAVLGDSLTAGLGVKADETFPARLQARLDRDGYRYRVLNAGISGDTSAGGLGRLEMVLELKPAVLVLALGANDGLRGLPLAQLRRNLEQIIERSQDGGTRVVLAGMRVPPNYGNEYADGFAAVYRELAEKHGTPLIPFLLEGVGGKPELNQPDGVHPTAEGYRIVADTVWKTLQPMLEK